MKIEGIILAAGLSTRTGVNKMILNIKGKTVIERCILGMYDLCSEIIIVGGHRIDDIRNVLDIYPRTKLIYNPDYLNGMFSSVKKGLIHVKEDRFFLIPGDYPAISKKTYEKMLQVNEDIVIPTHNGKRGHPLLMKTYLIDELLKGISCNTLRDFVHKKGFTSIDVGDPGILMDIDTMEDYGRALNYLSDKEQTNKNIHTRH